MVFGKKEYKTTFYGDFTYAENYQAQQEIRTKNNILRQKGYDYPTQKVEHFFKSSDFNIVNLETPITNVLSSKLEGKKSCIHWSDVEVTPKRLKKLGVDVVTLGNNHALDYGEEGLFQTLELLDDVGIAHFGAGKNLEEASRPYFKEIKLGSKKCNLYVFGGYKYREDYEKDFDFYAKENKPGVFVIQPENVAERIKEIKENDKDAYIVMFPHFGFDNQKTVPIQRQMAKAYLDAGADIVIGHGPHHMNEIEYYNDKPIVYALGNFIFLTDFKDNIAPYGLVAQLVFSEKDILKPKVVLYPVCINERRTNYQPRPILEEELEEFLGYLFEGNESLREKVTIDKKDKSGIAIHLN